MKKNLIVFVLLIGCFSMAPLVPVAQAYDIDIWRAGFSCPIKVIAQEEDYSGNRKFANITGTLAGTMEMYVSGDDIVLNGEGCYVTVSGAEGTICIREIAAISTHVLKSKSDKILFKGMGDFSIMIEGNHFTGLVYLDVKGTLKKVGFTEVGSATVSGKLGGGTYGAFVFTGSFKATLTK